MLNFSTELQHTPPSLWQNCQQWLEKTAGSQYYETWFRTTSLVLSENGIATLEVPNTFFASFIESNFRDLVLTALRECGAPSVTELRFAAVKKDWQVFTPVVEEVTRRATARTLPPAAVETVRESEYPPFPFNHSFDTYVAGDNNNFAYSACLAVAEKPGQTPFNPLTIFGGTGLGKTHLLHAVGNFAQTEGTADRVCYLTSQEFADQFMSHVQEKKDYLSFTRRFKNYDILLIDDIQFLSNKEGTQKAFFEIFTALMSQKKQIVLSSDQPPKEIPKMMGPLISRFDSGLIIDVKPPAFETRVAILQKKAMADGVTLPDDVVQYIASAVTSNVRELEGTLIKLIASASFTGRDITLETAQEIFGSSLDRSGRRVTIDLVQEKTAAHFGVSTAQLRVDSRKRDVTIPRNIAMFLCKKHTKQALRAIGLQFGRDYSTVIHACKKVENDLTVCAETREHIAAIETVLKPYF